VLNNENLTPIKLKIFNYLDLMLKNEKSPIRKESSSLWKFNFKNQSVNSYNSKQKGNPIMYKKNLAFTLAEVLITLGIIGVVVALTIPTLSTNIRGSMLKSQFEKTYADLNQAARKFYQDNDMTVREYSDSIYSSKSSTKVLRKFMNYFKGYKDSSSSSEIPNAYLINGKKGHYALYCDQSSLMQDLVGRTYIMDDAVSPDNQTANLRICVDINGYDKPNKWGVDKFVFVFTDKNNVAPCAGTDPSNPSAQVTDEKIIKARCSATNGLSFTCAYFALKNISPEGNGDYWHDFLRGK
jgi:type II secretory pathway pseudopilin PulG